jgi:predicted dehydrogenase
MSVEAETYVYHNGLAGGALLDVGIYGLTFAALFLGTDPVEITAAADVWNGVDRQNCVVLKYENGALANISSAVNLFKPETAYLYGSKGYVYIPTFYGAKELFVHVDGEVEHIAKPCLGEGFEEEILEACRCIREGKQQSDILPMAESIKLLRQMDAIRKQIGVRYPWDEE